MPENMDDIRSAVDTLEALPVVQQELEALKAAALKRAFEDIRAGKMTPELANYYLMELYSYHKLATRLDSRSYVASNTLSAAQKGDMNVT